MGTGRDRFTAMFATGSLAGDSAVVLWGDYYINRRFGFALSRPPGWHYSQVKDMGRMKAGMIIMDDPEISRVLMGSMDDPIVTVTKDPLTDNPPFEFSPGCTIYIERYDEELDGIHRGLIEEEIAGGPIALKEYSLLSGLRPRIVSGSAAYEYRAAFLFQHLDLARPVPVQMRVLSVYQNPALYDIRMYDAPALGDEHTFNYDEFISNLRFA